MNRNQSIEQLAAQWVCRSESPEWGLQDQAALDAWLAGATEHRVAWLRLQSVWRRADRLAAMPLPSHSSRQDVPALRQSWWLRSVAASLAVAVLFAGVWHQSRHGRSTYATGVGGHQTVPLVDGSRLELNTRTRLRTQVDADKRAVWLDRGEAYFDIKRDPSRPFVVYAGDRRVTVLGTKFSVRREGDRLEVAVVEGKVRVERTSLSKSAPPTIVTGGDILFGKSSGTLVAVRAFSKVARDLSWREGLLVFDQSTLAEAAAEFNRYNQKQLILEDDQTAQVLIGGSFDADGVEAFARLLEHGFNLQIEQRGDEIRLSQK